MRTSGKEEQGLCHGKTRPKGPRKKGTGCYTFCRVKIWMKARASSPSSLYRFFIRFGPVIFTYGVPFLVAGNNPPVGRDRPGKVLVIDLSVRPGILLEPGESVSLLLADDVNPLRMGEEFAPLDMTFGKAGQSAGKVRDTLIRRQRLRILMRQCGNDF